MEEKKGLFENESFVGVIFVGGGIMLYWLISTVFIKEVDTSVCEPLAKWESLWERPLFGNIDKKAFDVATQENTNECYEMFLDKYGSYERAGLVSKLLQNSRNGKMKKVVNIASLNEERLFLTGGNDFVSGKQSPFIIKMPDTVSRRKYPGTINTPRILNGLKQNIKTVLGGQKDITDTGYFGGSLQTNLIIDNAGSSPVEVSLKFILSERSESTIIEPKKYYKYKLNLDHRNEIVRLLTKNLNGKKEDIIFQVSKPDGLQVHTLSYVYNIGGINNYSVLSREYSWD